MRSVSVQSSDGHSLSGGILVGPQQKCRDIRNIKFVSLFAGHRVLRALKRWAYTLGDDRSRSGTFDFFLLKTPLKPER